MKKVIRANKVLCFTLLFAVLIMPIGLNNKAVANSGFKVHNHAVSFDNERSAAEDYSIPGIEFIRWI